MENGLLIVLALLILALVLYVATRKTDNEILGRWANIATIVSLVAATIVFVFPGNKTEVTSLTYSVFANQGWSDTGLEINKGETVTIEYQGGAWTYWSGKVAPVDGNGNIYYTCAELIPANQCVEQIPNKPKGSLIAQIGTNNPFYIGNRNTFKAPNSGKLLLNINDSYLISDYVTNEGSLIVKITIEK